MTFLDVPFGLIAKTLRVLCGFAFIAWLFRYLLEHNAAVRYFIVNNLEAIKNYSHQACDIGLGLLILILSNSMISIMVTRQERLFTNERETDKD